MKRTTINFWLILLPSLAFGFVIAILKFGLSPEINSINGSAAHTGELIGSLLTNAVFSLVITFVIALIIDSFLNQSQKEKKPLSYSVILISLVLSFILLILLAYNSNQHHKCTQRDKLAYANDCIKGYKSSSNVANFNTSQMELFQEKATTICSNLSNSYFKFYDDCLDTSLNIEHCKWISLYQICMELKNDDLQCKQVANTNS